VAVLGGLEVDWLSQIELLDDDTWSQVEVLVDDFDELVRGAVRGTVRVDKDGERLCDTDGVGELHECAAGEFGMDKGLGNPAGEVGRGAVDLGEILAGEGTTSVSSPSSVCVDDNLSAGQTSVTLWSTDDEESRGLDLDVLVSDRITGANKSLRGRWSPHSSIWRG
jgi:hypothetical protein